MPEDTACIVTPLEWNEVCLMASRSEWGDEEPSFVSAYFYDISFVDSAGQAIEPAGEVSVTLSDRAEEGRGIFIMADAMRWEKQPE